MRSNVSFEVSASERAPLEALVTDPKTAQKHVWRARIVLLTADGFGTMEIIRRTGKTKPTVWRWQAQAITRDAADVEILADTGKPIISRANTDPLSY